MKQISMYFKSDFTVILASEGEWGGAPFRLKLWTASPAEGRSIKACFNGEVWHNCRLLDDGRLQISVNQGDLGKNQYMGIGTLKMDIEFYLSNQDFNDHYCNEHIKTFEPVFEDENGEQYHLFLDNQGASTLTTIGTLPAFYMKGDPGKDGEVTSEQMEEIIRRTKEGLEIPTKTSQLQNDSNFISTEKDPTVPSWAKQPEKPTYTAQEVGALPASTTIPSKTSQLQNDSNFLTQHQPLKTINGETIVGQGNIVIQGGGDGGNPVDAYTKTESDAKYQTKGDYATKSELEGKQDVIADLATIRSGAAAGATALQSFTESDPTVPSWAKQPNKPTYNASEVGAYTKNECDTKFADIVTVVNETATTVASLTPNVLHKWGTVTSITISAFATVSGKLNEYMIEFVCGDTAASLSLPSSVKWQTDRPEIQAGKTYQISIVNNLAVMGEF